MLTNQHSLINDSQRHKSRGECYGTVTHNAANCSLSLGSATSHVYNDYFEGNNGTAYAYPGWVGSSSNDHGTASILKAGSSTQSTQPYNHLHFTVSLWVKPTSLTNNWQTLCGRVSRSNVDTVANTNPGWYDKFVKLDIKN